MTSTYTTKMSKTVILDSSALIAQINLADSLHEKVQPINEFIAQTNRQVILPYEVFAEALNIFGKKVGRREAASAGKALLARHVSGSLKITPSDETILAAALDLLVTAKGQSPSFVDCLVMVGRGHYQTKEIFGFDDAFTKNGYRLPEAAEQEQAA
jgi:predicted nucleic acid-binding protein